MEQSGLYSESVDAVSRELADAGAAMGGARTSLLRHYLANLILYTSLSAAEQDDSPVRDALTRISALLDKLRTMQKKIEVQGLRRVADRQMMRNKDDTQRKPQSTTPRLKYKRNAERLSERTRVEHDPNIDVKKAKSNRLG